MAKRMALYTGRTGSKGGTYVDCLECKGCGKKFPVGLRNACDECFSSLEVKYRTEELREFFGREFIQSHAPDMWRYWPLLPADPAVGACGLNPGMTPLRECRNLAGILGVRRILVKDDTVNPTYSFKDRPVAVSITKIFEFGLMGSGCASTGNLAGAVAAASAKYSIPSYVIVPSNTDRGKIVPALAYGAKLIEVEGTYDDANRISNLIADRYRIGFVNINLRPYYVEGSKTIAMETVEQLGWKVPDRVIVPMGSGALLTAVSKGFNEFDEIGLIGDSAEIMISGTQPAGCSPISHAFAGTDGVIHPVEKPETVAESLAIGDPASGYEALSIINRSGGFADAAEDREICDGQMLLARHEGIFAEPAGGCVIASLRRKIEDGTIGRDETVVCLITGNGLKSQRHLDATSMGGSYRVRNNTEEVEKIFKDSLGGSS
jgi:threonine synthase